MNDKTYVYMLKHKPSNQYLRVFSYGYGLNVYGDIFWYDISENRGQMENILKYFDECNPKTIWTFIEEDFEIERFELVKS